MTKSCVKHYWLLFLFLCIKIRFLSSKLLPEIITILPHCNQNLFLLTTLTLYLILLPSSNTTSTIHWLSIILLVFLTQYRNWFQSMNKVIIVWKCSRKVWVNFILFSFCCHDSVNLISGWVYWKLCYNVVFFCDSGPSTEELEGYGGLVWSRENCSGSNK